MAITEKTRSHSNQRETKDSPAIWFFVAAIFVTLAPTFGNQLNIDINPVFSWIVGAGLTSIGFWAMFQKSGKPSQPTSESHGY